MIVCIMKKKTYGIVIVVAVILIILAVFVFLRWQEDTWIRSSTGEWVKHGEPSKIPEKVEIQQEALAEAESLYLTFKENTEKFSSDCLGTTSNGYAVDMVHVPRTGEDELEKNQCPDFLLGEVDNFIEVDKNGTIVRIVD